MNRIFAAVTAALASFFTLAPAVDHEAVHSDAAMAVAYASLVKAPVLPPKPAPTPAVPVKATAAPIAKPVSKAAPTAVTPTMHLSDGYWEEIYPGSGWIWWTWPGCKNWKGSKQSDGIKIVEPTVTGEGWFGSLPPRPKATIPVSAPVRKANPPVQPAPRVIYRAGPPVTYRSMSYGNCSGGNCQPRWRSFRRR